MDSARDLAITKGVDFVLIATSTKKGAKAHVQGVNCGNYKNASVIDDSTLDRYVMCKTCVSKLTKYPNRNIDPKGKAPAVNEQTIEGEQTEIIEGESTEIIGDEQTEIIEDDDHSGNEVADSDYESDDSDEEDIEEDPTEGFDEGDDAGEDEDEQIGEIESDNDGGGNDDDDDLGGGSDFGIDDDLGGGDDGDEPYKDDSKAAKGKKKAVVKDNSAFKSALRKYTKNKKTETRPKYLFDVTLKSDENRKIPFWDRKNEYKTGVNMAWLIKTVDKKVKTRSGKIITKKESINYRRVVEIVSRKQNYLY